MLHALMMAQSPPCFAAVRAAANKRPPSQAPRKTQRQKPTTTTSHGFGGKKKDPVWQCVQNCGACCKLDKGPSFPSPDEIFDDPSDVQVYFHKPSCSIRMNVCILVFVKDSIFILERHIHIRTRYIFQI